MNRREILQGGVLLSAAMFAGLAEAAGMEDHDHDHMQHQHGGSINYSELAHAATHCVMFGEACIGHCLELLGQGDKDMAACAKSVEETLAACNALRQLATWESVYVPRMAKVVMDICKTCEDECRKHEKHKPCRDCAEACAACYKECAKVAV
ncbi:MAG TPA: four-helix bundle copper-binding protein [Rhodocyclaceae bacterium]|nr:four-helix bundle copper-binding protein [Rhodocyclaceae bacterium]